MATAYSDPYYPKRPLATPSKPYCFCKVHGKIKSFNKRIHRVRKTDIRAKSYI
jgi:hypothetical protein